MRSANRDLQAPIKAMAATLGIDLALLLVIGMKPTDQATGMTVVAYLVYALVLLSELLER